MICLPSANLLSSRVCCFSDQTTSAAVRVLPLWNSTPRRSLNAQVPSGEPSQLSARLGCGAPLPSISTSVS